MGEMVSGRETARAGAMLALLLYAFPLSGGGGSSAVAIRGPYLQLATTDSITVCWRTDIPTDSSVVFGPNPGSLNSSVFIPGPVTDHRVTVIGLDPATTYFYAIGTGLARLAGGDVDH